MKSLIVGLLTFVSLSAFATSGIDCRSIDGNLEISTDEAAALGNNLMTVLITAPFISKSRIELNRINAKLIVDRQVGPSTLEVVYMASSDDLQLVLKVNSVTYSQGTKLSEALITKGDRIYKEMMICQ